MDAIEEKQIEQDKTLGIVNDPAHPFENGLLAHRLPVPLKGAVRKEFDIRRGMWWPFQREALGQGPARSIHHQAQPDNGHDNNKDHQELPPPGFYLFHEHPLERLISVN